MHLLFEEENYPTSVLAQLGLHSFWHETSPTTAKCNYVGFYKNYDTDVAVFTLPKIFLHNKKVFGSYDYLLFAHKSAREILTPKEFEIVRNLAEKIYFCLRQYQHHEENTSIIERKSGLSIKSNIGINRVGSFEAMLALISFNKANPYLFVQERQIFESKNPRSINWKKTIASSVPVEIDGAPLYLELKGNIQISKRNDPLLIIFYSLLNEFRQYDPSIVIDTSVEILPPARLEKLKAKIAVFLRTSRTLYFSDKFRQLHTLLQSYYFAERANYSNQRIEFLYTDDFEIVFEKMVDSLISDEYLLRLYKHLKDGKEIDHLFDERDVFLGDKIIYIGDSKYYKDPSRVASQHHKQFTYARNIIQEIVYVINAGRSEPVYSLNYRDAVSEGYNVTPNFFILGSVASNYQESYSLIELDNSEPGYSFHFPNRLFDRDTLHILYFKADFLRLMNYYIGKDKRLSLSRQVAKEKVKATIQQEFVKYLNSRYEFYRARLYKAFIEEQFKVLHGKVFTSPAIYPDYMLALEKTFLSENADVLMLMSRNGIQIQRVILQNSNVV